MTEFNDELQYTDFSGQPSSDDVLRNQKYGPDTISAGPSASRKAAQSTILGTDDDMVGEYKRYLFEDNKAARLQSNYTSYIQNKKDAFFEEIANVAKTQPELAAPALTKATAVNQEAAVALQTPTGPEQAVTEELTDFNSDEELSYKTSVALDEAMKMAASNDIAELTENVGWVDTAINIAGYLVPFGQTKDISDITTSLQDKGLEFAQGTDDIKKIVMQYHMLPVERRMEYWPILKKAIVEVADDNELKAAQFLSAFLDPVAGADSLILDKRVDAVIGGFDVFTAGAVRKLLGKLATMGGVLAAGKRLSSASKAGKLNAAALMDAKVAEGLGTDRFTALQNAFSVKLDTALEPKYLEGLSAESQKELADYADKLTNTYADFKQGRLAIRDGLLSDVEKKAFLDKKVSELKKDPVSEEPDNNLFIKEGYHLSNIEPVAMGEDFGVIQYDILDAVTGEKKALGTQKIYWTEEGIERSYDKSYEALNDLYMNLGNPTMWMRSGKFDDLMGDVLTAGRLETTSEVVKGTLYSLVRDAYEPLSGVKNIRARDRLNKVLLHGDEVFDKKTTIRGKDFTAEELREGVETKWGVIQLRDKEIESYMKVRQLTKFMHQLQDEALATKMRIRGFKQVKINDTDAIAKPYETAQDALQAIPEGRRARVYDTLKGEVSDASPVALQKAYDEGKIMVRLDAEDYYHLGASDIKGAEPGEVVRYVLVDPKDIKNVPTRGVLPYKPGYIPKINKHVQFLVKERIKIGKMDGEMRYAYKTHRFTGSKQDAEAYLEHLLKRDVAEGAKPEELANKYKILSDREQLSEDVAGETENIRGSLYTGHRASSDILYGPPNASTPGDRLDVIDALQRYMGNLSRVMSRQDWRLGLEEKWLRLALSKMGNDAVTTFSGTKVDPSTESGRKLEHIRRTIRMWNSIPTKEEAVFDRTIQRLHDYMLEGIRGVGSKKFNKLGDVPKLRGVTKLSPILWLKNKDPYAAAKSAAFHPLLGMYNPVQLWVQSQNMAVALSAFKGIHAEDSVLAVADAAKMALLDNILDPDALRAQYRILAESGDEAYEYQKIHQAWLKTGYADSVRTNPDIEAISKGRWMSKGVLRRTLLDPMVFYRTGELANRRVSFAMAYRLAKRANGGKDPDLKKVMDEANKFMMNLGRYNAARWQGGPDEGFVNNVLSVMTQFKQVTVKATDNMVFRGSERAGFTVEQKAKILGGQVFLYGAAGVPLGTWLGSQLASMQPDWDQLSDEQRKQRVNMWNQFAVGIMFRDMLGAESEVAKRGAILSSTAEELAGLSNLITSFIGLNTDNSSAPKLTTTFGTAVGRYSEAFSMIQPIVLNAYEDGELTKEHIALTLSYLKDIASSGRNITKAMKMMHSHVITAKSGDPIVIRDWNLPTELAALAGFQPSAEEDVRVLKEYVKDIEDGNKGHADIISRLIYDQVILNPDNNPEMASRVEKIIRTYLNLAGEENIPAIRKILEEAFKNPQTQEQKAVAEWIKVGGPNRMHQSLVTLLTGAGVMYPKAGIDIMSFGEPKQTVGEEKK